VVWRGCESRKWKGMDVEIGTPLLGMDDDMKARGMDL